MKIPEEFELLSLFESEPRFSDDLKEIPFFYNQARYILVNDSNQICQVDLAPAYDEMKISVSDNEREIVSLDFRNISSLTILDQKTSRFMITRQTAVTKIQLKPVFTIFHDEK